MSTEKTIYSVFIGEGLPAILAKLIVAQTKHETAVAGVPYMSRQFLVNNNIAGYGRVANSKWQTGSGGNHPEDSGVYAKYASIENAAHDLAGWYKRRSGIFYKIETIDAFVRALKTASYFTDSIATYKGGVTKYYKDQIV